MKRSLLVGVSLISLVITLVFIYHVSYLQLLEWKYDFSNQNPQVYSSSTIDSLFTTFESISFGQLPKKVKSSTNLDKPPYNKLLLETRFYKLKTDDLMMKVVRDYRICDFLAQDVHFYTSIRKEGYHYTNLNPKILKTFLLLLAECKAKGYDISQINLTSCYRHPKHNYLIGGASQSRHLFGDAIDISVGDINNDGKSNKEDKGLILTLLDTQLIGNKGGIGLYPKSKAVHFDLRGHKARWNSYTPAYRKK